MFKRTPLYQDDAEESGYVIESVAWSPDGSLLAVGSGRAICSSDFNDPRFAIQALNGGTEPLERTIIGPRCSAKALAWSPNGSILISGGYNGIIWFWDVANGERLYTETVSLQGPSLLIWSPDSSKVFGTATDSIFVFDTETQILSFNFPEHKTERITSLTLSPDGSMLASGNTVGIIYIMDTITRQNIISFEPQPSIITALAWRPDGGTIASGSSNGMVTVWDAETGAATLLLHGHTENINRIVWNPNGLQLASASDDGTVRVWNITTGEQDEIFQYPGRVPALDWSPDSSRLAYSGVRGDFRETQVEIVEVSPLLSGVFPTVTSTR